MWGFRTWGAELVAGRPALVGLTRRTGLRGVCLDGGGLVVGLPNLGVPKGDCPYWKVCGMLVLF